MNGMILSYSRRKGYGFIKPDDTNESDFFFHANGLVDKSIRIEEGMKVAFEVGEYKNRLLAVNIVFMNHENENVPLAGSTSNEN